MEFVTCKAPVNIAILKYWGKRDEKLILPLNDSISVTLSTNVMRAKTSVAVSPDYTEDRFWLNGREEIGLNSRTEACLSKIRELARSNGNPKSREMASWKVHIVSENNFPTAAGLASSAAGFACLVYALAQLFKVEGELSQIARIGSGSACRSIYGGFVVWKMGKEKDGSDSVAKQIAPASHWNELKVIILVVSANAKAVGSTIAMQRSVLTSDFLKSVRGSALEGRANELTEAILSKNFDAFARIAMKDSNRVHSICLDTYPPVQYLNDTSHYIIQMVHFLNDYFGKIKVAYSFDAGPNSCLFLLEEDVPLVLSVINHFLPESKSENGELSFLGEKVNVPPPPPEVIKAIPLTPRTPRSLKGIIYVGVGDGPEVLEESESLIDNNGFPKNLK